MSARGNRVVSISSYTVADLVFAVAMSYFFLAMVWVVRIFRSLLLEWKGSARWFVYLGTAGSFIILTIFYSFAVKIGWVMFIDGFLLALLGFEVLKIFSEWGGMGSEVGGV